MGVRLVTKRFPESLSSERLSPKSLTGGAPAPTHPRKFNRKSRCFFDADACTLLTATAALVEYVQRRKQLQIVDSFGPADFDPGYNYKLNDARNASLP